MIDLLKELDGFRKGKNFKRFGFAIGGDNNEWIKKVKKLSLSKDNHTHEAAVILAYIGYAYVTNKGDDSERIKKLRQEFDEKILQNM